MPLEPSNKKNALFAAITVVGALFFLEAFASWALMLRMRIANIENFTQSEPTYFSLINIPYKGGVKLGLFDRSQAGSESGFEYRIRANPSPTNAPDGELGYKPLPGKYRVTFSRRTRGSLTWQNLSVNVTRKQDGTRWTGECPPTSSTNVYIFGDSWVAGDGVNDEQTFAFLLQQARKDLCVTLFAVGGYGMTQSFIQFQKILSQIRSSDIIILGYADYFDVRTEAAPSRLREVRDWFKNHDRPADRVMLPKATLDGQGVIHITYVQQRCDENNGYCNQPDPSKDEMAHITAALINEIAETTKAPVYLLHFDGTKQNPMFGSLNGSVRRISALPEDFDDFIRDDIVGFDSHPGPYWHYAISRKLIETLPVPLQASRQDGLEHIPQTRH
jgi:hypothetical protein